MPALLRSPLLTVITVVVVAACAMLYGGGAVRAQAPGTAPSPGLNCMDSFLNLTDCLSYVVVGSNDTKPAKECCPELAGLYDSNPICLCELLAGAAANFGISIDNNRALKLPSICHIDSLPVSLCSEIGIPVASPAPEATSPSSGSVRLPPAPAPTQNLAAGRFGAADLAVAAGVSFFVSVSGIF
ncbi:xylogen-like protein 11 [Canna indica]|uniref:Xylogen-like protein 11 n=1 Tax=Canna indica TaxID=4628 RepID=A0AAQ3KZS5_9LILI|nr:xylogen-like protein 11 [Canna indica]